MYQVIPYQKIHFDSVLAIFHSNTPSYFHPSEEADFIQYLNYELEHYFVILYENRIIGAGGINRLADKHEIRISWDLIHPDYQGKGAGTLLLKHRLDFIKQHYSTEEIIVRTAQLTYLFYEKNGFKLTHRIPNFWAEGFDLYLMNYEE